ncbi:Tetratricopeptide TPR_1 repeat-containing protein [Caldicellulosiruptor acetigenus I77R1B]|uniref:Tetratricopeptide TPR_1 repeat-containing protein n=2 Tax=Caldicellulosiruptor acetigenus TaxID=301953 RepID=G2PVC7_9FIRM|nr:tetratricopeptide repeat protein [Caldicellulosiruptor acetigenus]ADQ41101.1 Tetratricopeptide TPR_1 repeat-containing protein [Caldicellulosiruptor acetigenus I77R1B]AEM73639.1 Tetratricopeptide TPR_1 repeat-containing protein [Caldicellulosiruptor acetigenus 6A]WAM37316.1 hypothetical protein OTK01_001153 [Caldicellulosiruptor acetigenus]
MEDRSLISFYIDKGDYEKAKDLIFGLLKENPYDISLYLNLALIEIREKNLKKAEEYAKQALSIDANHKGVWAVLGKIYHLKKEYSQAEKCYLQALKIDSAFVEVLVSYSELLIETGFVEKGLDILKYAQSLEPTNSLILQNEFYVNLYQMNYQKANESIRKLFSSTMDIENIYVLLILYEYNRSNFKKAYEYAKLAFKERPTDYNLLKIMEYLKMINSPLFFINRLASKISSELLYIIFVGISLILYLLKQYSALTIWSVFVLLISILSYLSTYIYRLIQYIKKIFTRVLNNKKF